MLYFTHKTLLRIGDGIEGENLAKMRFLQKSTLNILKNVKER